jgi:hypothetical protein
MGRLLGNGVRSGIVGDVIAAGEGIETVLSVRSALPDLPIVAALSANHLAALLFRVTLRRTKRALMVSESVLMVPSGLARTACPGAGIGKGTITHVSYSPADSGKLQSTPFSGLLFLPSFRS